MLAKLLLQVYCLEWMLGYHNVKFRSYSADRQLFVYTKNSNRKYYVKPQHNQAWMGAKLGYTFNCMRWYAEEGNLGCVALAVSFSGFHSSRHLICCTDWTVMLINSLLWGICSLLDSGLLATAVKVSKSLHNSTIKSLIQNSPILFQDNIALSLHCTFQSLMFSDCRENANSILWKWHTHSHTSTHTHNDYRMPLAGSAHQSIMIYLHLTLQISCIHYGHCQWVLLGVFLKYIVLVRWSPDRLLCLHVCYTASLLILTRVSVSSNLLHHHQGISSLVLWLCCNFYIP